MTLPHSIIHINEGLRLRFINISFHYNVQFLNVKSIFYLNVMNREEIIRNVLYLEVASLWRHHHPQQQHQGWRAANKWSDGNENSLYRNTAFTVVHKYTLHCIYIYIYAGYHYFYCLYRRHVLRYLSRNCHYFIILNRTSAGSIGDFLIRIIHCGIRSIFTFIRKRKKEKNTNYIDVLSQSIDFTILYMGTRRVC